VGYDVRSLSCPENAVSEVIGSVLLISVVVVSVSIIGVFLFSQPPTEKIPSLNAIIWNDTQKVYLRHDGGDAIYSGDISIYVNGTDQTSSFYLSTAPAQPWTNWSIGKVLQYSTASTPVSKVQIVYIGSGSSAIILAST
jgi:FlaG/FlaF family flagellin (archaellin)